ncbi:MAG: prepilin-type N-terminal cleavage/methylation domain-containing protein [Henriciella sp.]|uniref:PulJ/GspJ family protein n=1 Tax=Henriciella sp. TaxID=1968823 RepID=UPI003C710708
MRAPRLRQCPRSARREAGFSLLETLIGLTLTALISASLFGAIQTGSRMWISSEKLDAEQEQARLLQVAMTWLEFAIPDNAMNAEPETLFSGASERLSFVVAGQAGPKDGGFSRLVLETRKSETCSGKTDLVLHWADVTPVYGYPSGERVSRVLLDCMDSVRFNYYGTSSTDTSIAWKPAWRPSGTLPAIISLRASGKGERLQFTARPAFAPAAKQYENVL